MKIEIEVLPGGSLPTKCTEGSACYDIYARDIEINPDTNVVTVLTGIKTKFPPEWELTIRPRSNLSSKRWAILNSPGTVDSDYRGEIMVVFTPIPLVKKTSMGSVGSIETLPFPYKKGDRIAQVKIERVEPIEWVPTKIQLDSERKDGGFGSTGGISKESKEKIKKSK